MCEEVAYGSTGGGRRNNRGVINERFWKMINGSMKEIRD